MPSLRRVAPDVFKHQADATINQTNPGDGTKYEWSSDGTQANKLGTQKNVQLLGIIVKCTWTVQPTPLEIHAVIDGVAWKWTKTDPVSDTDYFCYIQPDIAPLSQTLVGSAQAVTTVGDVTLDRYFSGGARSVKVEAEITGGTVSNLSARVKYAKIP